MKKLFLFSTVLLMTACSDPGASDSMPFEIRFVIHDEEGTLITEDVTITYLENGEEKLVDNLQVEAFNPKYHSGTFATHWVSRIMAERASSGRTNEFI